MYPIFPFKCLSLSQFGVGSALFIFTLSLLPFPFFSSPYFPSSFTMNSHKVCFHDLINYLSAILLFLHVADFGYKSVFLQFQSSQFYAFFLLDICHYAFSPPSLNFHGFCATSYTWIFTFSCLFLYFFLKGFCSLSLRIETICLSFYVH